MKMKCSQNILTILLRTMSVATFVNVLVMYWLPVCFPLSSFTAVRLAFIALAEERYYLILGSVLICVLLFVATISIRRKHCFLPMLLFVYMIYDFNLLIVNIFSLI